MDGPQCPHCGAVPHFEETDPAWIAMQAADALRKRVQALEAENAKLREEFHRVMDQYENDLSAAHAEIVKLQGGDPAKYSWPEWSGPANSLRWFERLREQFPRAALGEKP